jgi:hypothetical protein
MEIKTVKINQVKPNPKNPRIIKDDKFKKLVKSIKEFPDMLNKRPLIVFTDVDKKYVVLGGNMRLKACNEIGLKEVPVILADEWTEEQKAEFLIKDNVGFGEWDWDDLANEWDAEKLEEWGLDVWQNNSDNLNEEFTEDKSVEAHKKLTEDFIIPPFSVLDSRQGHWQERKKHWKTLIQDEGESRIGTLSEAKLMMDINNGVSLLDPVLSELANLWFGIPKGKTFDCFAGDSVFGYVSSYLGNKFTGVELRQEQADLNNERVKGFDAKYICDDGRNVLNHIEENSQDLLFSCPPYFDLEVYSDLNNDASNQETYEDFIEILDTAFSNAIKCLKENRFAVITVGDIRDKNGFYYRFPDDIKDIFKRNGMLIYNELILVETLGTLPQRVGRYMKNRKIGKCHQNILVFYKGEPKEISKIFPNIQVNIEDESTNV